MGGFKWGMVENSARDLQGSGRKFLLGSGL